MNFMIRKATARDYKDLCALYAEVDALHRDAVPSVFRVPDGPARSQEFVSAILADEQAALFVAEGAGKIVGLVCVRIRQAPDIPILMPRRYARLEEIVVSKPFQRQGVGQALLDKAHRWALEKGIRQVELTVWEFNQAAIAFYERQGYTIAHRTMWRML